MITKTSRLMELSKEFWLLLLLLIGILTGGVWAWMLELLPWPG